MCMSNFAIKVMKVDFHRERTATLRNRLHELDRTFPHSEENWYFHGSLSNKDHVSLTVKDREKKSHLLHVSACL